MAMSRPGERARAKLDGPAEGEEGIGRREGEEQNGGRPQTTHFSWLVKVASRPKSLSVLSPEAGPLMDPKFSGIEIRVGQRPQQPVRSFLLSPPSRSLLPRLQTS